MANTTSHRGLALDPLHPNISQLVDKYESVWGNNRTSDITKEVHGRTPWITVSSNALVGGINGKEYELKGDWEAHSNFAMMADKRVGVAPSGNTDSKYIYYGGSDRYLPKAGVKSFDVDAKGGLGSIRYGE